MTGDRHETQPRFLRHFRVAVLVCMSAGASEANPAVLNVRIDHVQRSLDRHRLLGSNLALWHEASQLFDADLEAWMKALHPAYLRIPGGSWSDEYYWNGNGVWSNGVFDMARLTDGYWDVDFSAYAPGFRVQGLDRRPADFHGNVDVLALHELIAREGSEPIVTVNAGTGRPELAAEWVRWANLANDYHVTYWEVGNELEGSWELGHILPDGSRMTGEEYARRFLAFAEAMKAVDPSIRIGGPAASNLRGGFMEDLLRIAGKQVDFVTVHTYPVERHLDSEQAVFDQMFVLEEAMDRYREWIEAYVPDRADAIEIGITEWNAKVVEDRDTADLVNGLWTAMWVGEMFRCGVSFATQWDLLTATETGGHGLFFFEEGRCVPKSQFWGLYLWSRFMGNDLLDLSLDGPEHLRAYATRDGDVLAILLVNTSREQPVTLTLRGSGAALAAAGAAADLSFREYVWHPYEHRPVRSEAPTLRPLTEVETAAVHVAPFSARVVRIPLNGATDPMAVEMAARRDGGLSLILPAEASADLPVEGWVVVDGDAGQRLTFGSEATLAVEGPAESDRGRVRIGEAAGRFFLAPRGEGRVTVHASWNGLETSRTLTVTPVTERVEVVWEFEQPRDTWSAVSSFSLAADDTLRPNRQVAAVRLDGDTPRAGHDTLLAFEAMPDGLPLDRIGGVVFDILLSPDFACEDEEVGLTVVLQSEGEHWIPLERIPLPSLAGGWRTLTVRLPDPKYHAVMRHTYALRFQISQRGEAKQPVEGGVAFDKVGFLIR